MFYLTKKILEEVAQGQKNGKRVVIARLKDNSHKPCNKYCKDSCRTCSRKTRDWVDEIKHHAKITPKEEFLDGQVLLVI